MVLASNFSKYLLVSFSANVLIFSWFCSGRKNSYFGLERNLIRHLISPNQDDLSYSARTFISGHQIG